MNVVKVEWITLYAGPDIGVNALNCVKCGMPLDEGDEIGFIVVRRSVTFEATSIAMQPIHIRCPEADTNDHA